MRFLILLFLPLFSFCQQNYTLDSFDINIPDSLTFSPQKLTNHINSNYKKNEEKVRILYVWITNKIKYDEKLIDSLKNEDLIMYTLKSRSGKCKNFSALLTSLCNLMNIEAYSVLGYTKVSNKTETTFDHAWNIIKIENSYYLFDPTWDSNMKQFNSIKKEFEFLYFIQESDMFIKSHMPYDPAMQIQNFPITHQEFFLNKTNGVTYFNFNEILVKYNQLSEKDKLHAMLKRAEEFGINIPELEVLYKKLTYFISNTD